MSQMSKFNTLSSCNFVFLLLMLGLSSFELVSSEELDVNLYRSMLGNVENSHEACIILELIPKEEGIGSMDYRCDPDVTVVHWNKWLKKARLLTGEPDILHLMDMFKADTKRKGVASGLASAFSGVQHILSNVHQSINKASCLVTESDECIIAQDPILLAINEISPSLARQSIHNKYIKFYAQMNLGVRMLFNHGDKGVLEGVWSGFKTISMALDLNPLLLIFTIFLITTRIIWHVDFQFLFLLVVGYADHLSDSIISSTKRIQKDIYDWCSAHYLNRYNSVDVIIAVVSYLFCHLEYMNIPQYALLLCTLVYIRKTYDHEDWGWKQIISIIWSLLVCFYSIFRTSYGITIEDLHNLEFSKGMSVQDAQYHLAIVTAMAFVTAITAYTHVVGDKLMKLASEHQLKPETKDTDMVYTTTMMSDFTDVFLGLTGFDLTKIALVLLSLLIMSVDLLIIFTLALVTGVTIAYYVFKIFIAQGCIDIGRHSAMGSSDRAKITSRTCRKYRFFRRIGVIAVIALSLHPGVGASTALTIACISTIVPSMLKMDNILAAFAALCVGSSRATHLSPILMVFNLSDRDITVLEAPV